MLTFALAVEGYISLGSDAFAWLSRWSEKGWILMPISSGQNHNATQTINKHRVGIGKASWWIDCECFACQKWGVPDHYHSLCTIPEHFPSNGDLSRPFREAFVSLLLGLWEIFYDTLYVDSHDFKIHMISHPNFNSLQLAITTLQFSHCCTPLLSIHVCVFLSMLYN